MKLPLTAPNARTLLTALKPDEMQRLFELERSGLSPDRYLHWDELRHRNPPEGCSLELWWLSIRLARRAQAKMLPLLDKTRQPLSFTLPEQALRGLHNLDRDAAGNFLSDAPIPGTDARERYLVSNLIEEAITSSQLEGASTTRRVAEDMLRQGRKPRDLSERMIFNNHLAMRHIQSICQAPLTPEVILELHRMLTLDTLEDAADAGRLRSSDDVHVIDQRDQQTLHVPPPANELPERLQRLCAFANGKEEDKPYVPPVVRAILLHFMIGYDHPFVDGNGRTARALFYWSMLRQGYWLVEYISISSVLRKAPAQYARAYLHTETDEGDTTYFILHQLEAIQQAISDLHAHLKAKTKAEQATARLLRTPGLLNTCNHRQIALLTHALKHADALYTIEGHRQSHAVTYATARADLLALAESGLLVMSHQGKKLIFTVPDDLDSRLKTRAIATT
jgi:Fic family protein